MTVKTITQPPFVVDLESERSTAWPENSLVWCRDTNKLYELKSSAWMQLNVAQIPADWNQASSVSPDFIKNKPTVPAAQVQSDWSQASSGSIDFVKNKPSLWRSGVKKSTFIEYIASAVVSGGVATFYLTDDGTSAGNAVFASLFKESAGFWVEDAANQYQFSGYTFAANKKSVSITIGRLGSILLGLIQFVTAANGVTVYLTIKGE